MFSFQFPLLKTSTILLFPLSLLLVTTTIACIYSRCGSYLREHGKDCICKKKRSKSESLKKAQLAESSELHTFRIDETSGVQKLCKLNANERQCKSVTYSGEFSGSQTSCIIEVDKIQKTRDRTDNISNSRPAFNVAVHKVKIRNYFSPMRVSTRFGSNIYRGAPV